MGFANTFPFPVAITIKRCTSIYVFKNHVLLRWFLSAASKKPKFVWNAFCVDVIMRGDEFYSSDFSTVLLNVILVPHYSSPLLFRKSDLYFLLSIWNYSILIPQCWLSNSSVLTGAPPLLGTFVFVGHKNCAKDLRHLPMYALAHRKEKDAKKHLALF